MADQPGPASAVVADGILVASTIRVVALRPDDILVVTYPERLSEAAGAMVRRRIRERTSHERILILDSGADVAVVRPDALSADELAKAAD
jgi:hypothetical protein